MQPGKRDQGKGFATSPLLALFILSLGPVAASAQYWPCCETYCAALPTPGETPGSRPQTPPPSGCGQDDDKCECTRTGGNPVDLWNGREFFTLTDLVLPGMMDIVIRRSYDSKAQYDSALGYGWALGYFIRLYEFSDGSVILRRDCGVRRPFYYEAGAYQTPVGETGTLVKNGDGSWTYREKSGERKEFDGEGKLTAVISPQGPKLVFTYDSRGKLPLIGLSPYAVDPVTPREVAREFRLTRVEEQDASHEPTGRWVSLTYDENSGRLTTITDSAGRTVQYAHDGIGNLTQVSLPENETQIYAYEDPNDPHNATTLTHRGCSSCGTGTTINTYDSEDRVIRQERGLHRISFSYDIPYLQTTVTEETYDDQVQLIHEATSTIEFNELGNPVSETDPLGNRTVQVRDPRMNITRKEIWEDQGGPELVLAYAEEKTYDAQDNVLTYIEAAGFPEERTTTYGYDEYGRLTSITVPSVVDSQENKVTSFTYDENNNVLTRTKQGLLGNGTPFTYITTYTYNGNGQLETIDGPRTDISDVTTYNYDTEGRLTSVVQPLNLVTTYSDYTTTGEPQTVTDPNGIPTTYTYDAVGRVTSVTVDGDTTSYTYTPTGKIEQITLPRLNTMSYSYDTLDRLITITDGLGNTINYTYDSSGNTLKEDIKDAQGTLTKTVSYQYDILGRLYRVNNPDGNYTEYGYDAKGNTVLIRDPNGNLINYQHDGLNRLALTVQPGNITTSTQYDIGNNLFSIVDGNSNATTFINDDMGCVFQEISPDTGTTTYEYDEAGNVISKTDGRGVTVNYHYDAINRPTLIDFPSDTDIVYSHDTCTNGKRKLCQVQDQAGTTSYAYSTKGLLVQKERSILGVNYITSFDYDDNGNLISTTYPSGRLVSYSYDSGDQATTVTTAPPGGTQQTVVSSVNYQPFGGLASLTYGNKLTRTVAYDQQHRITNIQTSTVHDLSFSYDPDGNITAITDSLDANKNRTFDYDALNRLSGATGPWGNLSWTYDSVGNRLTYTDGSGTTDYSYQIGTNRVVGLTGATSSTLAYDGSGNIETKGVWNYTHNDDNRLVQVTDRTILSDYTFNANGQRAIKTAAESTVYHYGKRGLKTAETLSNGTVLIEYIYLDHHLVAVAIADEFYYVHTDHLATPASITDEAGAVVWTIDSRPFGDSPIISGSVTFNARLSWQYFDEESGLHQNYFREYDPQLGRYIEADPLGLVGGINPYPYVLNNPLRYVDPLGLTQNKCVLAARVRDREAPGS